MSFTPINVSNPLLFDLTLRNLDLYDIHPFILGNTTAWRFQLRDYDDAAVSVSGATIVMLITSQDGTSFTRSTANLISGSTYQIKTDTDQSAETGYTGKGWYQVNFLPSETATFANVAGETCNYRITITLADTSCYTHFKGRIDVIASTD